MEALETVALVLFKLADVLRKIANKAPVSTKTFLPPVVFLSIDMFCVAHVCSTKKRTNVRQKVPPYCMPGTKFFFENIYHCLRKNQKSFSKQIFFLFEVLKQTMIFESQTQETQWRRS